MIRRSGAPSSSRRVTRSAEKTRQRQLHQLGRLEPELAEADPTARTLHVDTEARHQDDQEEDERDPEEQWAQPPQLAVIEADRRGERHDADRHPHAFPDEDGPRASVERDGDDR